MMKLTFQQYLVKNLRFSMALKEQLLAQQILEQLSHLESKALMAKR